MNRIPKRVDKTVKSIYPRKIPYIFMQNSSDDLVSDEIAQNIHNFINTNPEYTYMFFDDDDSRAFILENFPREVINAFDELVPGAYKSDLFRYCFMYINGGVYLDINKTFAKNLKSVIDDDYDFISCIDRYAKFNYGLWQAILASPPGTSLMRECIKEVVANVQNKYYGINGLSPTGPLLIGNVFKRLYESGPLNPGIYFLGTDRIKLFIHDPYEYKIWDDNKNLIIFTDTHTRNSQQKIWDSKSKLHYSKLYIDHKIYMSEFRMIKNQLAYLNLTILMLFSVFIALYMASLRNK